MNSAKEKSRETYNKSKETVKRNYDNFKETQKNKYDTWKENTNRKIDTYKDKVKEKITDYRDKVREKKYDYKEKIITNVKQTYANTKTSVYNWTKESPLIKEKISTIKKRIEKKCSICGKIIHGRDVCLACLTSRKINEYKDDHKTECNMCGKTIYFGKTCATCKFSFMEKQITEKTKYVSYKSKKRIKQFLESEEEQEKAMQTMGVVISMYRDLKETPKRLTAQSLGYIADNVMINHEGKVISLEKYAQLWMSEDGPHLEGTTIYEDPAQAVTYVLLFRDKDYIINEMKIIKNDEGEYLSLSDAVIDGTNLDTDKVTDLLEIMDAYETFTDESVTLDDVDASAQLLSMALTSYNQN